MAAHRDGALGLGLLVAGMTVSYYFALKIARAPYMNALIQMQVFLSSALVRTAPVRLVTPTANPALICPLRRPTWRGCRRLQKAWSRNLRS